MTRNAARFPDESDGGAPDLDSLPSDLPRGGEAARVLSELAASFLSRRASRRPDAAAGAAAPANDGASDPHVDARYRALVEQMPAVVFMANLDDGVGEAYVSPQIESALGFSQQEWLDLLARRAT